MSKEAVSELQATSSRLLPMMPPPGVRASATVKLSAHASSAAVADPLSEYQPLASERLGELPVLRLGASDDIIRGLTEWRYSRRRDGTHAAGESRRCVCEQS